MRALALFGHFCLVVGCYLVAWGINLLPVSSPEPLDILTKPLFWGLISILGGVCANMHSRCRCIRGEWPTTKKNGGGRKQPS